MDRIDLRVLKRTAAIGAIVAVTGSAFLYYKIQERFHRSPYFIKSLETLKEDKEVIDFLGPPISTKFLNLGRRDNVVTETHAQLHIPLKGKKNSGELVTVCSRTLNGPWKVDKLELIVRGKNVPVYFTQESDLADTESFKVD